MEEIRNSKKRRESIVELVVAALDGTPNPLDMDISGIDPDRTSLDLPEEKSQATCSNPRCLHAAVDRCPECGCPICADCLGSVGKEGSV